jgi:pimeloyl-ACP methyl ester carboxylesterase
MLVGHDFGSPVAAYCALARPDVFPSVVLMSAPFPGPPTFPFNIAEPELSPAEPGTGNQRLTAALAALDPPREYYQQYLSSRKSNHDMWHPPQGLHAFLRAFFYIKRTDWPGNKPHPLEALTAPELAQMPTHYVIGLGKTMPATVAPSFVRRDTGLQMAHRAGTGRPAGSHVSADRSGAVRVTSL